LPNDGVGIFTNICLLVHVAVAYAINSIVIAKNMVNTLWPGFLDSRQSGHLKALRWGFVSTFVLILAYTLAVLLPFFSDMMDILSAVAVFLLSVGLPPAFALLAIQRMRRALTVLNAALIMFALAGIGLGLWAAVSDVVRKFAVCPVKFGE